MIDFEPLSVTEVARLLGMHRAEVYELERRALAKMARHPVMKALIAEIDGILPEEYFQHESKRPGGML